MSLYLGLDTSNYTTSTALYDTQSGKAFQQKQLLPVAQGGLGLKQSDAVFLHTKQMGELLRSLLAEGCGKEISAIGASYAPRDEAGSYMPCFLVGTMVAASIAATLQVPCNQFSHQAGHVAAALYSADQLKFVQQRFLAFHFSGGTTQCLLVQPDEDRIMRITTVAETLDLNAGQAVDRVGRMLGLSFPAGPELEKLALRSQRSYRLNPTFKKENCCLSGLENQCSKRMEQGEPPEDVARFCLDYLSAVAVQMTDHALHQYGTLPLIYAGGVMSNTLIRNTVMSIYPQACFAEPAFSADNAVGTAVLCAIKEGGGPPC